MRILYFAWLRAKVGVGAEEVDVPAEVGTVAELLAWLGARGGGHAEALADLSIVKVAVNQEFAGLDDPVSNSDEVALFPPVTGG